ncbi:MAG: HEAT repeat domain-containing protein [Verrucomicrobia bacterium]|nr:HEAT repeat domain-containing protein [Verrucomicrobiota bacterium]
MRKAFVLLLLALLPAAPRLRAITPAELESRFKPLPTVPEDRLPALANAKGTFRGLIRHEGLEGHTWVAFPFVENPGSLGFDPQGRLYVAEANRFWLGVPDLRGANELIRGDFQSVTVADRLALYRKHASSFPEGWFSRVADRLLLLEDRDGNGAADHRSVFSDRFRRPEDGIGFSVLADEGAVFFTCIPSVWRLRDTNGDGRADEEKEISTGYGVRVSFIGHDLHGIVRGPDGRLYFSVGDRGYHVTTADGQLQAGSGRGAIFRCESDGSGLEVFCTGLRNPQELVFDELGNLFTFDNTGDIGDKARMVYAIEGSDSGWNMAHQSAHHYATHLDWGVFRPEQSMWVKERMFDLHHEDQPQWVYPPASHVANGPSGVTWLTGESLPADLRAQFLLANYRGAPDNCNLLLVGAEPKGAGYVASGEREIVRGVGASDVELGYDGRLYICDFGGGWSVNENGSIQVAGSLNPTEREAGAKVAAMFREGFAQRGLAELRGLLSHPDRRVRQAAQFALAGHGAEGVRGFVAVMAQSSPRSARLHALWGLGQLGRRGLQVADTLVPLLRDGDPEIRANAARVLGDLRAVAAKPALIEVLAGDDSIRVRSLAAIALGRIADAGDAEVTQALFAATLTNGQAAPDIVLRHALLSALSRVATTPGVVAKAGSGSREERLLAVLVLRRRESGELERFLGDTDPLVRREVIRAIHDTRALDSAAGEAVAALRDGLAGLPEAVQRRIVAANYRKGTPAHALGMLRLAADDTLAMPVRKAAFNGLKEWEAAIDTDPVLGHYRPQIVKEGRAFASVAPVLRDELIKFLGASENADLTTLAIEFANKAGIGLEPAILFAQARNAKLGPGLRVAVIESLLAAKPPGTVECIAALLSDQAVPVRAAAVKAAFTLGLDGIKEQAVTAVGEAPLPVARAALAGIAATDPGAVVKWWNDRQSSLRPGLWLDAWLALSAKGRPEAAAHAASAPDAVFRLGLEGGDVGAGEIVFKNQGACLQCHKVGGEGGEKGGVQGPDLRDVGKRLAREKILESVANPGAEIAPGYGMTTVTLKSKEAVIGRISRETPGQITVTGLDNRSREIPRGEIASVAPPVSAMPPVAAALPPGEFRDLIAFLASQKGGKWKADDASHGDAEKIAK